MRGLRLLVAGVAGALLVACAPTPPAEDAIPSATMPREAPDSGPEVTPRSDYSLALGVYYRRLQNDLLAQGLMREDGGGPDTPFTDEMLARNFVRIALFDEYADDGVSIVQEMRPSRLRRWEIPVRYAVGTGPTTTDAQNARRRSEVSAYVTRLARATRHDIAMADDPASANFHVLFLDEDERIAATDRLRALVPGITDRSLRAIRGLPRSTLCVVLTFSAPDSEAITRAVAIIRSEHPNGLRMACIHEELAQGLGLPNDHPQVRPSIFNDDEEFSRLTRHDELLLRILYDSRLRPGMTAAEAAPVVREIARELVGAGV